MYSIHTFLALTLMLVAFAAQPIIKVTKAASFDEPSIAVVELQALMGESLAVKSIKSQVESQRSLYQGQISTEENRLREKEQELARQRSILSAEAFNERRREFENEVSAVQRSVVELRRQLDQAYANGVKEIRHEIAKIIDEIAQEKGLTLILPQEQTLYVDDTLRISREVLKRLDDRLPALDLDFETN